MTKKYNDLACSRRSDAREDNVKKSELGKPGAILSQGRIQGEGAGGAHPPPRDDLRPRSN